jgi:ribosomal protein L24E
MTDAPDAGKTQSLIESGKNPERAMWTQCPDINSTATLICFIQLSFWSIPVVVIVGDTLADEMRECFCTPAHRLGTQERRLAWAERENQQRAEPEEVTVTDEWV